MDDLRPDALATVAARVVAWHNRHPLARRITAEQVQSVGYVALPFLAPTEPARGQDKPPAPPPAEPAAGAGAAPGKSLRERALERAQSPPAAGPTGAAAAGSAPKPVKASKVAALKPAFTEDFIAPLRLSRVVRWAAEHGATAARPPRDAPVREVAVEPSLAGPRAALVKLYVLTAMVEIRGKRVRMLLGGGSSPAVIGNRLWSPVRLATGSGVLGSAAAAAALGYLLMPAKPPAAAAVVAGVVGGLQAPAAPNAASGPGAPIASIRPPALRASAVAEMANRQAVLAASSAPPVAHGGAVHAPEAAAHAGTPTPAPSAPGALAAPAVPTPPPPPPATKPVDVEPTLGRIDLAALGLPQRRAAQAALHERRQAALATAGGPEAATPGEAAGPAIPAIPSTPAARPAAPPAAPEAAPRPARATAQPAAAPQPPAAALPATAPPAGAAFAVSSRQLRTRAEAEQTQAAMRALLLASGHTTVHVDLVPAGEDWRVVGWPFAQRAQAEGARGMLATRGMRVTVIDF